MTTSSRSTRRARRHARLAIVLVLTMLGAGAAPHLASAGHGSVHPETRASPTDLFFEHAGGWLNGVFHATHGRSHFATHLAYDPVDDAWTELPFSDIARARATAASLGGFLYVAGGDENGVTPDCRNTARGVHCPLVERYDPVARTWTRVANMPTPRADAGVAVVGGILYVVGGEGDDVALTRVEAYNPVTDAWLARAPLPEGRTEAQSLTSFAGRLWLAGGTEDAGFFSVGTNTAYVYDPALDLWSRIADLPAPISHAGVGVCNNELVLFGGMKWNGDSSFTNKDVYAYDITANAWRDVGDFDAGNFARLARGGSLTQGDLTMAVTRTTADALVCPTGSGPWTRDADLVVDSIALAPSAPEVGDVVELSAVVTNRGPGAAGPTRIEFAADGVVLGTASVPALTSGASATVQGPSWTAVGGDRVVEARVDDQNLVLEWNEDNNHRAKPVRVPMPDLVVSSIGVTPADAAAGDTVRMTAVVRNAGDAPAGASSTLFALNFEDIGLTPTPALEPGESATVESPAFTLALGRSNLFARADELDEVDEDIEWNNGRSGSVTGRLANLLAVALVASPEAPRHGDATTFTATVRNTGDRQAAGFAVRFELADGTVVGETRVAGLAAGAETTVASDAWSAVAGEHVARAVVDAQGEVAERDETDNAVEAALAVGPERLPDLLVAEIQVDPESLRPGLLVTTRAVVRNDGEAASAATVVRFARGGTDLGEAAVPALAPGESATVTAPLQWRALRGSHVLSAVVDPADAVRESDETNNAAERTVTV